MLEVLQTVGHGIIALLGLVLIPSVAIWGGTDA
jgi:hypothetical protein